MPVHLTADFQGEIYLQDQLTCKYPAKWIILAKVSLILLLDTIRSTCFASCWRQCFSAWARACKPHRRSDPGWSTFQISLLGATETQSHLGSARVFFSPGSSNYGPKQISWCFQRLPLPFLTPAEPWVNDLISTKDIKSYCWYGKGSVDVRAPWIIFLIFIYICALLEWQQHVLGRLKQY